MFRIYQAFARAEMHPEFDRASKEQCYRLLFSMCAPLAVFGVVFRETKELPPADEMMQSYRKVLGMWKRGEKLPGEVPEHRNHKPTGGAAILEYLQEEIKYYDWFLAPDMVNRIALGYLDVAWACEKWKREKNEFPADAVIWRMVDLKFLDAMLCRGEEVVV